MLVLLRHVRPFKYLTAEAVGMTGGTREEKKMPIMLWVNMFGLLGSGVSVDVI